MKTAKVVTPATVFILPLNYVHKIIFSLELLRTCAVQCSTNAHVSCRKPRNRPELNTTCPCIVSTVL